MKAAALLTGAVAAAIVGCAPADGGNEAALELSNLASADTSEPSGEDLAPILVLGGDESDPRAQFHGITSATRTPQGFLLVANGGSGEVFGFDQRGRRSVTMGGEGGGPGESLTPMTVTVLPSGDDTVFVANLNPWMPKLSLFSIEGELAGERLPSADPPRGGATWDVTMSPRGTMFSLNVGTQAGHDSNADSQPPAAALVRFDLQTGAVDSIGMLPGPRMVLADLGRMTTLGGGAADGMRLTTPIFGATSTLAGGGDPYLIAAGDQTHPVIWIYDEAGVLQRRIRWDAEGRPPSRHDIELAKEEFLATPRGISFSRQAVDGRAIVERMPIADRTPVYRSLVISRTGEVWVERFPLPSDSLQQWWVFSRDGVLLGTRSVQPGHALLEVGADYYIVRASDDLDVQRVEIWPSEPL